MSVTLTIEQTKTSPLVFVTRSMDVLADITSDYTAFDIEDVPGEPMGEPVWHVEIQGSCVKVTVTGKNVVMPKKTKGCQCGPFSKGAMMRMLRYMNRIDWKQIDHALFITLTYPDQVAFERKDERNQHRYLFMRYVEMKLGKHVATIWRCEWKIRKTGEFAGCVAPHFHVIIPNVQYLAFADVNEYWRLAIGGPQQVATDVRRVTGHQGALRYLAKYVGKDNYLDKLVYLNNGVEVGRSWGVTRKHLIPMSPIRVSRPLTDAERDRVQLAGTNKLRWYDPTDEVGFTLLGDEALQLFEKILHLPIAKRC